MNGIDEIQETLLEVAKQCANQGPGFAQESVVLREAAGRLNISRDLSAQQRLLNAWHDLFRIGKLYWGYDIDNPGQPFFHFPQAEPVNTGAR
ncbi:MAG: hypothetical protein ABSH08_14500 [Tepidisphaeraceae bacterium]|jgi:hypothetical protein